MTERAGELGIIVETDVAQTMRDGVVLRANVFRPDGPGTFPALLWRTPYGKGTAGYERYVRAGYAVVCQDTRGRYASDGDWVPFTTDQHCEAEDGYDTVEWLAAQPYCNGRMGTFGASYCAWMQWQLAKLRPPHLVAMFPQSIPTELTDVDYSGAFRPARRIHWWRSTMAPDLRRRQGLPGPHTPDEARKIWDEQEHGRWVHFMPWLDVPKYLPKGLAEYADDWLREPSRRPWRFTEAHREVEVPYLDFSGWYDHCASMAHLPSMQQHARTETARTQSKLILGPWSHVTIGQRKLGPIDFGPQAQLDTTDIAIRWFDHWLRGVDNGVDREPAVRYFVMGSCQWKSADTWPPPGKQQAVFHLSSDGLFPEPPGDEPPDAYTYDPHDPVPTLWSRALFTEASDRRALAYRTDILNYRTPPLEQEIEVVGYPEVVLYASSSAPDTDFFARLIDEFPDGEARDICMGMVRARHRRGLDRQDLLTPGEVTEFRIRLGATACRFLEGHRIRLEITSSDYPNFDRNHNTGGNDLAEAELAAAEQKVFHDRAHPSRLIVTVDPDT